MTTSSRYISNDVVELYLYLCVTDSTDASEAADRLQKQADDFGADARRFWADTVMYGFQN